VYRHRAGPKELRRLPEGAPAAPYTRFAVTPVAPTIGGLIEGVDLREPLDDELFTELDRALHEWKVLLFREQHLTVDQQAAFALHWGDLVDDQIVPTPRDNPVDNLVVFTRDAETVGLENEWHTDGTFRTEPTLATVLRAVEVPATGGDTIWADMAAAYDNLPPDVRASVETLDAVHDWTMGAYAEKYGERLDDFRSLLPPVVRPVVSVHPVTGRKTLFVNRLFTRELCGVDPDEGEALLDLLCRQAEIPEYQCRFHWEPGSIAFWDNLAVQHYGVNDYWPQRRVMARATVMPRARA